jgi:hypothetical protein
MKKAPHNLEKLTRIKYRQVPHFVPATCLSLSATNIIAVEVTYETS